MQGERLQVTLCHQFSKLAEMERRFGVIARWTPTDKEFVDVKRSSMSARRDQLHTSLWASVVKRHYLLQMKAKYAVSSML